MQWLRWDNAPPARYEGDATVTRLLGILQLVLSVVCLVIVVATAVNLGFIIMRPDSISVANAVIGQSVLIICFLALARVLLKNGRRRLSRSESGGERE